MASRGDPSHLKKQRRRSKSPPPLMSELRIVLLAKNSLESNKVGNFILRRAAFDTEAPPPSVEHHSERARGKVEGRYITLINTPHLLNPQLSEEERNQRVKECVSLCAPGPHVFLLALQSENFTQEDHHRIKRVMDSYSMCSMKYTIVLITDKSRRFEAIGLNQPERNQHLELLIRECQMRFKKISTFDKRLVRPVFEKIDEVVNQNGGQYLTCEINEKLTGVTEEKKEKSSAGPGHAYSTETEAKALSWRISSYITGLFRRPSVSERLNLVVCGSDGAVKSSISDLILGQRELRPESSSVCVRREGEVCGLLVTLVEMPALYNTQLSEEEVMQETLRCVSLCDPGVDAFLFIVPEGRLTDENKGEIEKIQRIFGSKFNRHTLVLITQQFQQDTEIDEATKKIMEMCSGAHYVLGQTSQVSDLIELVKKLVEGNNSELYRTDTYLEAQLQNVVMYQTIIDNLKETITRLKAVKPALSKSPDTLRIVLLGKTGVGKSATGNTILGKENVFHEDLSDVSVTTLCQKESADINGRQITVIDTPGLFDTNVPNVEVTKEITKCISMAAPGPHVFLLVLKVGQRFTQEEQDTVNLIKGTFGEKSKMYTIVLFTRGDELKGKNIKQYVESAGTDLRKVLFDFGNRYHVLNNSNKTTYTQVTDLLKKIDSMVTANGGSCYTNEMFQQVEKTLQEEQERILKEKEEEIEREKERLKAKYEAEMEGMRIEIQKEKERQEAEGRRREKEFKEKELEIKREMTERERKQREDIQKRREEDEKKMQGWMAEIHREREENRQRWEKQREEDQRRRDQEEEERRKKEEEWKKKQKEEGEKFEKEREDMEKRVREELMKLQQDYKQKAEEEEKRRKELEEKIQHAEESKKKELQELQLTQQREWIKRMEEEEKRRDKQQKYWEKTIASMEEAWTLQQIRKQKQHEWEKQKEKEERDLKEKERKEKEEQERKRIENEANKKIGQLKEQLEAQREKEEKERKEKDEQLRKEMEEQLQKQLESFRKKNEEEETIRNEAEKRNLEFIKETHTNEMENLKRQTEQTARKQAEEEFYAKLDEKVKEAKEEGFEKGHAEGVKEGCAKVESERTRPGRAVDQFVNFVCRSKKEVGGGND